MHIRFTQPFPPYDPREQEDLSEATAIYLIQAGYAEEVIETAFIQPQLQAATRKYTRKKATKKSTR
jgi:hypothetical protein